MNKATKTRKQPRNRVDSVKIVRNALRQLLKAAEDFEGLSQDQYERRACFNPEYRALLVAWKEARDALQVRS